MSNCKACNTSRKLTCWNCGEKQSPELPMMRVASRDPKHQHFVERWFCHTCYRGLAIGYGLPDIVGFEETPLSEQDILSGVKP